MLPHIKHVLTPRKDQQHSISIVHFASKEAAFFPGKNQFSFLSSHSEIFAYINHPIFCNLIYPVFSLSVVISSF